MHVPGLLIATLLIAVVHGKRMITFGNTYKARLPEKPFFAAPGLQGNVRGFAFGEPAGRTFRTQWIIRFENLPKEGGPFSYHVHAKKVKNGNCTTAGRIHDPRHVGERAICYPENHLSCQGGDLSGKHGVIDDDPFFVKYTDHDTSIYQSERLFFGDKSIVITYPNGTRLTCANFVRQSTVLMPNATYRTDTVDLPVPGPHNGKLKNGAAKTLLPLMGGGLVALTTTIIIMMMMPLVF